MSTPTGTREWASTNVNIAKGCEHNCKYCYGRSNALRFKQIDSPSSWEKMEVNWDKVNKNYGKKKGTIMFQ